MEVAVVRIRFTSKWMSFTILAAASSMAAGDEPTRDLNIVLPAAQEAQTGRFMLGVGGSNVGVPNTAQIPGTGNPFLNSTRPRPTLLSSPVVDENVVRASFDQPV